MPATKQVRTVFDGKHYWLIWHWETLVVKMPKLDASAQYIRGPFYTLEAAEKEANEAIAKGWTPIPYQTS